MSESSYFLCRLCAFKCSAPGTVIFSADGLLNDVPKKIEDCLQLTISEDDKFPKIVCSECTYKLDSFYEFKERSLSSQQFLSELFKHDVLGNDLVAKDVLQSQEFQCLSLGEDMSEQTAMQELENLVDEAHLQTDTNDISKMIQYHDNDISAFQIEQIEKNIQTDAQKATTTNDTMSLPDITLYTFDSISDAGTNDNQDILIAVPDFESSILNSPSASSNHEANENCDNDENCDDGSGKSSNGGTPKPKRKQSKICEHCGKSFSTNYKLREHERTHTKETPFHCKHDDCTKKFRSKIGLIQHEAKHVGKFKFSCEICGKGFEIKSYLTIHLKTHSTERPFKCSMCDFTFKAKQGLIDHENRHLGLKPFECPRCHKRFITKSLCLSHLQTHSETVKRDHQCLICSKFFATKSCMKMHMKIHVGDKKYSCRFCGKAFLARTDLRLHETTHSGQKEFICETCGKLFNRPNSLNNHIRLHTGDKPYKCKYCPQSFAQSSPMKIHMRLHTGERPYNCSFDSCTKKFVSRTSLQRHVQSHNRKQPQTTTHDVNQQQQQREQQEQEQTQPEDKYTIDLIAKD